MFDCCGLVLSPHFRKKPNFQNGQKSCEKRTNMDIILSSFLAKPMDKHGITLVHITYPPLRCRGDTEMMKMVAGQESISSQPECSQDALRVDDELSASFDDSTNVRSKGFISRDI